MRVVAGIKKGHKLKRPSTDDTRPTEDRIKESIFNSIGPIGRESIALDLFAGSGAIGIEFLSRGVSKCYFVDKSNICIKTINENLEHTKLFEDSVVIKKDSIKAISELYKKGIKFEYIYIDPPYKDFKLYEKVIDTFEINDIVTNGGLLIFEHESSYIVKFKEDSNYKLIKSKKYGNKTISFIRYMV